MQENLPFVELKNVTFGYDEHVVLDRLSFQVLDGDQVTLAGRTGAGKRHDGRKLLLGLYKPQKGSVTIHGVPSSEIREKDRRKLFGHVEQSFPWCRNRPGSDHPFMIKKKI